ncbi:class I SAM-dependent methyltransferase [Candidatus Microgenomates bacterium]|nr:MAG: class I SAM-dependent methyltransferase [Candidatus Microgenomates bacterium]
MDKKNHYKKQKAYFNKEFSSVSKYSLESWQKNYIEKINKYLLDKDYKKKTLLDIGTGTGYVAIESAKKGVKVIGCDLSVKAIENLKKYKKDFSLNNLTFLKCNAEELPLKNESVNYIVANAILEHLPKEEEAINEWKRVLKKNGKIFITVPLSLKSIWPFLWPINIFYDKRLGHIRRYDKRSLEKKFGLKSVHVFYTGHLLKVFGTILSLILRIHLFDEYLDLQDLKKQHISYGASNISLILRK